ncbi:MAG: hypothetical protein WDN45_12240 [Caulobacteraceae bacterium]
MDKALNGMKVSGRGAQALDQHLAMDADVFDGLGDHAGHADAFEDDVGLAAEDAVRLGHVVFLARDEVAGAHGHGPLLLEAVEVGDHDGLGAHAARPEGGGQADRPRAQDHHLVANLQAGTPDAVQGHRQGLHQGAVGQAGGGRQAHDLARLGQGVFAVAAADQAHLQAPGRLARQAAGAMAAALHGRDGDAVADLQPRHALAHRGDLAGELVAEHRARDDLEHRVLGHVQVRAADAAAADLDHHLARPRLGVGQGLDAELLAKALEDGRSHARTARLPIMAPPSITTWAPVMYDEASEAR